jgi:hypothetical protein
MSLAVDEHLRRAVEKAAGARGVSLSRYITEVLEAHLAGQPKRRFPRGGVIIKGGPKNLARDHDLYSFGD